MPDVVTLSCPSCGGKLQITQDIDRFACGYCGSEHIVRRSGGIVSLAPVVEGLRNVQTGVDKTAAELAIVRLSKEIPELEAELAELRKLPFEKMYPPEAKERLLATGALFFLATMCCALSGSSSILILWALLFLGCLGGWIYVTQKRIAVGKVDLARRTQAMEARLADRKHALENARRLVDS